MAEVPIDTFVRVVALPLDGVHVHLVVEATRHKRRHRPNDPVDFRAPSTVCGYPGYVGTERKTIACDECARGYPEASASAVRACRALLALAKDERRTQERS